MAPSDDLKSHATSTQDFYALLNISPSAASSELRRAYRRTALKYHPDKLTNPTPADLEKFHLLQIAYDVLSDPAVRELYDNAREARERRRREAEMLEGVRRKMKEDLEARERGEKRPWSGGPGAGVSVDREAEDLLEREIRRLAEDGQRRRRAKEEEMRREILEEEERLEREKEAAEQAGKDSGAERAANSGNAGGTTVPEIDRTIKVRWIREGSGVGLDKERLEDLFSSFGTVESTFTLKDKRQRVGEAREKKTIATGVVVFSSVVYAHAAVEDSSKQRGDEWDVIQSVFWASGKEPDWDAQSPPLTRNRSPAASTQTQQPASKPRDLHSFPGLSKPSTSNRGKKAPSFGSFGKGASALGSAGSNSPSLEELTLIRLKNAERKKLEEQIRKEDEAADGATK